MSLEKPIINSSFCGETESSDYTNKLKEKELDKIDPTSGLTWRELVYGASKETLKDAAKGKELKDKKKNLYERIFHKKKEKKEASREDVLKIIENYHKTVTKVRQFLVPFATKYFPESGQDIAGAQMELIAIQTLMRSQEPASLEAVKNVLKKEKHYMEIGGERKNLYEILFPEENENGKAMSGLIVAEKNKKTEDMTTDEALKIIRDYFDVQAKMYGMFDADVRKFFPKLGEQVEENRLAIITIESYLHLHDKTSLRAVQRILEDEKKYIKENKQTPLAGLFLRVKPQIKAILDKSDK